MEYLVLATSLRSGSHSRIMAQRLVQSYAQRGARAALVDLRDYPLPLCDGESAGEHPQVASLEALIAKARVVTLAVPIYNYDVNAAAKNLIELTGQAWEDKIVAFLCAAGGQSSYMSVLGLANSLMLDFRAVIVPRFVYATYADFADGKLTSPKVETRIEQLAEASMKLRYA
ncbi:MAG: NADPH-dependent FMN reductase [Chloracidobacterium sp.]|uniref:NAD(P)H-dependent oxidoreductase n=1 Tax=Chloracidobacterium validum TaxID=2821543 RepID=A0ABX8B8L0_9BACT|nr:NADPH-dependent FMN reductase [Chloracidobacterium validum]QUW03282.1 NAD(P)H-dependent oxidoreductase [Chloracidobacterium validum]